eukprot:TRINITY_DN2008_c0_g1_i2.p1 TRINITY_DN2008_c0_g1~~TRINITY_DN2008_c0_g1_i2.p1  ORF type:complete len:184 (+),score=20.05 TRINITY_DN2008_c0_g1_i2:111-662(+)
MHSNPLLSGTVPDSLGSLDRLVRLYMYSNPLLSTIPDSLGSLSAEWHHTRQPRKPRSACGPVHSNPSLNHTRQPRNPRSACAPRHAQQPCLGSLDQLVDLLMHSNPLLSGTVPDSLGSLDQLQWLLIHSNPLLPYPTASEASLMHSNPLLSGTVPDSLGSLDQLVYLYMYSNPASESSISLCT